jgi:hypothetical protein
MTHTLLSHEAWNELRNTLSFERDTLVRYLRELRTLHKIRGLDKQSVRAQLVHALVSRLETIIAAGENGILGTILTPAMEAEVLELRSWMVPVEQNRGYLLSAYDILARIHSCDNALTGASWPEIAVLCCPCGGTHNDQCAQRLRDGLREVEAVSRKYRSESTSRVH